MIKLTALLLISLSTLAHYGSDDRIEYHQIQNEKVKQAASAVAYQVDRPWLRGITFARFWKMLNYPLGERGVCSDERFSDQPTTRSNCSGVLVAPDILLTMGSCLTQHYCNNDLYYWMFDYHVDTPGVINEKWRSRGYYKCKEILKHVHDPSESLSYMLIRLNKVVKDREPIEISDNSNLVGPELTAIGHQRGMPMKIAPNAFAENFSDRHFLVSSDISGETKGSAIVNNDGELEGILLGGTKNFPDYANEGCGRSLSLDEKHPLEFALKTGFIKNLLKEYGY